jgi:hypothetical protein
LQGGLRVGVGLRVVPGVYVGAQRALMPSRFAVVPANIGIIDTSIHPKHVRLYLNDRFIGIADDFDGYLYLKAGSSFSGTSWGATRPRLSRSMSMRDTGMT